MPSRTQHKDQVQAFLQATFGDKNWQLTLPHGWGHESYFARADGSTYFVKLGVQPDRYQAMASLGLTPPLLVAGHLADGTAIIVQPYIAGRTPSRADYRAGLEQVAAVIHKTHHSPAVLRTLPRASSPCYSDSGMAVLDDIRQRWQPYRGQVPEAADFVDQSLDTLAGQVGAFTGEGLVASHNDICNANWLVTNEGHWYLIDLDAMSPDDPALDIGATLWWYYPPDLRPRFLALTGYTNDPDFAVRMRVRMALHCLNILLPRPGSFDRFDPAAFAESLVDFRAALAGEENPQGYED
jgi:thiamine kinase-like enzyme